MAKKTVEAAEPAPIQESAFETAGPDVYDASAAGVDEMSDEIADLLEGLDEQGEEQTGAEETEEADEGDDFDDLDDMDDEDDDLDDDVDADEGEDDSDDDDEDESDEDDSEDDAEESEDEQSKKSQKPKSRNNQRIQNLIEQKNALAAEKKELAEKLAEAERRAATTTDAHPDPEKELETLLQRYKSVKPAAQVLEEGLVNPLTGIEYTPAEAQAAVAEYKQDLQFQIEEARAATASRMSEARRAESIITEQLMPEIEALVLKYPELDEGHKLYNKNLAEVFQAVVDANTEVERGLVCGFKTPPAEFIKNFEKVLIGSKTIVANKQAKVDKKIDKTVKKGALGSRTAGKTSPEDELMGFFDDEMKELGAGK